MGSVEQFPMNEGRAYGEEKGDGKRRGRKARRDLSLRSKMERKRSWLR